MKTGLFRLITIALITISAINSLQAQSFITDSDSLQPAGGIYGGNGVFCSVTPNTNVSSDYGYDYRTLAPPPSTPGAFVIFTTNCNINGNYSNGGPVTPITANGVSTIKVTYNHTSGTTRYFDTEMLQLDISGGTLPPGMMLRESPMLTSTGQTTITNIGGGLFQISSFFDVFTELSTNGGSSWQPSTSPPAHNVLQSTNSIPTLSQWGLIALSVLVLGAGMLFVRRIV